MPPLAACLTNGKRPKGPLPARSSAASAEFRRNGIFRNTPFLKLGHRTHTQRSPSLTKETGSAGQGGMTAVIQAFILAKVVGMGRYSFDDMGLYVVGGM